uniref:HNH nuclease domain-containing protein n=1 Tax=viral metagenome TaxID=1070528 RepID=A0A6C0AJH3_9ZZZZ
MIRNVTESQKRRVAGRQRFKCAASILDYTCPLKGEPFDESGYEIDHIKELRDGGSNDLENLQALCIMCHRVKTVRMTSAMSKKETSKMEVKKEAPMPFSEILDRYRYQPKVPQPRLLCHHCHDQHRGSVRKDDRGLLFCSRHNRGSCEFLGCIGKSDVHARIVGPIMIWDKNGTREVKR